MDKRAVLRTEFVARAGWGEAKVIPLVPDASFRQYFRLMLPERSAMLMDAPPTHEKIEPFLEVTHHLQRIGLRPPVIFYDDTDNGFILLEDLGNDTFTRLLNAGAEESGLYEKAICVLVELHNSPAACEIGIGDYNFDRLRDEVCLFTRWYLPVVSRTTIDEKCKEDFIAAWNSIYLQLPEIEPTLVLRDYHVDNLIMVDNQCAVLDYQDALIGSPAYDVVSLLEDARRDIGANLANDTLQAYYKLRPALDRKSFDQHYRVWGAQRHCKVAGIFMRLWLRDNKPHYLKHLDRVMGLLRNNLADPALHPLSQWFMDYKVRLGYQRPVETRNQILSRIHG